MLSTSIAKNDNSIALQVSFSELFNWLKLFQWVGWSVTILAQAFGLTGTFSVGAFMQARGASEPRWHRGKQANRASARLSLRLLARIHPGLCPSSLLPQLRKAAATLEHHGSKVPALAAAHLGEMPRQKYGSDERRSNAGTKPALSKEDWLCKSCTGRNGLPYRNKGFRLECNLCKVAKGSCFGKKAEPRAEDVVAKRALEEKRAMERKHAEEIKALKQQLAEGQRRGPADSSVSAGAATGEMDLDDEGSPVDFNELDAAVACARDKLKKLKELPEDLRDLVQGGFAECCSKLQEKLANAQVTRRAANPLTKQLEGAEAHKARMEKRLADEKATLSRQEARLEDLRKQIELQKTAVQEAEATAAKAAAEVAALAGRFASERTAPSAPAKPDETSQAPPGFVSLEFAEAKWAEREAAFGQQLAQLQALVSPSADASTPVDLAEATPSEADASDAAEQFDEEAWSKAEPAKRKAMLGRQREILAKKLRANLGKVSSHASPFKKT